jgi:hypothetical protein
MAVNGVIEERSVGRKSVAVGLSLQSWVSMIGKVGITAVISSALVIWNAHILWEKRYKAMYETSSLSFSFDMWACFIGIRLSSLLMYRYHYRCLLACACVKRPACLVFIASIIT